MKIVFSTIEMHIIRKRTFIFDSTFIYGYVGTKITAALLSSFTIYFSDITYLVQVRFSRAIIVVLREVRKGIGEV
jgi:hypothetical protein